MTEYLQNVMDQSVPLYLAVIPLAATLYLLTGAVVCGLGKRYLGDKHVDTPDQAYAAGYLLWPLVAVILLVLLILTVAGAVASATLLPLTRKIGGEKNR